MDPTSAAPEYKVSVSLIFKDSKALLGYAGINKLLTN